VIIAPQDAIVQFQLRRAVAAVAPQVVNMLLLGWIWRLRNTNEGTAASVSTIRASKPWEGCGSGRALSAD
jgi:hypothetical protein